ncbi:MAG: AEC family transporter [Clostridium sp.]|nr:AEC family transporter [Clostridium sp.]
MNINVINQVIMLTLMMLVGAMLRKAKIISDEVNKGLTGILMNAAMPATILYSFNAKFSAGVLKNAIMIFFYSIIIHIFLIILSKVAYFKMEDSKKKVFKFATIFSNCGFVGYPVIQGIYGSIGVFYTSIFTIPFNILMFSYGVLIFTEKSDFKSIIKKLINIPTISIFVGVFIFIFSIKFPYPIVSTLEGVGNMTTPISMLIVGAMLSDVKLKEVFKGFNVYYFNFIKLIAAPILVCIVLMLFNANKIVLNICVILVAMPTASLLGVFAEKYDGDKVTASKSVFLTTVLSMFTIPAVISMIGFIRLP